jgi:ribosomal protein S18 acetylase RimI-like enzyme
MMRIFNRGEHIPWRPKRIVGALRHLIRTKGLGVVLVGVEPDGGRLVGYVVGTFNYDLEFAGLDSFVTELFVRPEYRRRGLGCHLVEAIASEMRAGGANAIQLLFRPDNRRARLLYERAGFKAVPRLVMTREFSLSGRSSRRSSGSPPNPPLQTDGASPRR